MKRRAETEVETEEESDKRQRVNNIINILDSIGIKNDTNIQVKWKIDDSADSEGKEIVDKDNAEGESNSNVEENDMWYDVTVVQTNTGRNHKFINIDDDEFTLAPVVEIRYESDQQVKEVCFISKNLIYDIEDECIIIWRMEGDLTNLKIDEIFDEEGVENSTDIYFTDYNDLEAKIKVLLPQIFISIVEKFKTEYENLPADIRLRLDFYIISMKNKLEDKILEFFRSNGDFVPGTHIVLGEDILKGIFKECFDEFSKFEH